MCKFNLYVFHYIIYINIFLFYYLIPYKGHRNFVDTIRELPRNTSNEN